MEIITGVERRRRWRLEEKLRIVAEVERPGASFAEVARRHEVSRGLLWNWRRQVRCGRLAPEPMPTFLPVQVLTEMSSAHSLAPSSGRDVRAVTPAQAERIEIALPDGTCIRVGADVGLTTLRRVMAAVIPMPGNVRVWLANGHSDMRRGMNGLALQVQQGLDRDPHAGDLYVFRGRRGDLVKILWHDGIGMSLYAKRLERGRFIWPQAKEGVVLLTPATLSMLLEGIDWRNPQRTWRPEMAG